MLAIWQVERLRDIVDELAGEIKIRVFTPDGSVFQIWYNPRDNCALYGKVSWREGDSREVLEKAWLHQIHTALNTPGVKVRVERRDGVKELPWFNADEDKNAVQKAFLYVLSLRKARSKGDVS